MNVRQGTTRIKWALGWRVLPVALVLTGCTVGPNYVPPQTATAPTWHSPLQDGLVAGETDPHVLASWWTTLHDPVLSGLIERAVAGNLDLQQARARIREARARRWAAQGALFPTLDATGSATWSRSGATRNTHHEHRDLCVELRCRLGIGPLRRHSPLGRGGPGQSGGQRRGLAQHAGLPAGGDGPELRRGADVSGPARGRRGEPQDTRRDLPVDRVAVPGRFGR